MFFMERTHDSREIIPIDFSEGALELISQMAAAPKTDIGVIVRPMHGSSYTRGPHGRRIYHEELSSQLPEKTFMAISESNQKTGHPDISASDSGLKYI